ITIWMRFAITDNVISKFTFWIFYISVGFASRNANLPSFFALENFAFRNLLQSLFQNLYRFAHLINTNHIPIVNIAIGIIHNIKIKTIIDGIWIRFANIIWTSTASENWACCAECNCIFAFQNTNASAAID